MEDRKKQVEEMAKELIIAFGWKFGRPNEFEYIAEYLVEQRYQKLTKDDVVLSKEEYEEYRKVVDGKAIMVENINDLNRLVQFPIEYDNKTFEDIADFGNYVQEQASKETAEKFVEKFENGIDKLDIILHEDNDEQYVSINQLIEFVDELAKQCGFEVKEN